MEKWRPTDSTMRPWLAILIVAIAAVGIVVTAIVAVIAAPDAKRADVTQLVFTALLPLFGTWVGTVMAFYFAKENLAAATESTARLTGMSGRAQLVGDVMVPLAQIVARQLGAAEDAATLALSDLLATMNHSGKHRLPILRPDGSVVYVVGRSMIDGLAARKGAALGAETLGELLADPAAAKAASALAFAAPTDSVTAARGQMGQVQDCKDLFVTKSGKKEEPVVGWLTDTDLARVAG
jgi:hypothetical protein